MKTRSHASGSTTATPATTTAITMASTPAAGPARTAQEAFERTGPERDALAPEALVPINTDVGASAMVALGAAPRINALAEEIRALPGEGAWALEHYEEYAQAAFHANYVWLRTDKGEDEVQRLVAECTPVRTRLLAVLDMAVVFALCRAEAVATIRAGSGYRALAENLGSSAALLDERWPALENKVPITRADLEHARELGTQLLGALSARERGNQPGLTTAADARQRAFTLLVHAYDVIRRAVTFARWKQGDADQIAPSLWLRPGGGRRGSSEQTGGSQEDSTPGAATPSNPTPAPAAPLSSPTVPVDANDIAAKRPFSG